MTTLNHVHHFTYPIRFGGHTAGEIECRAHVLVKKSEPAGWREPAQGAELISIETIDVECIHKTRRVNGRRAVTWEPAEGPMEMMIREYLMGEGLSALLDEADALGKEAA